MSGGKAQSVPLPPPQPQPTTDPFSTPISAEAHAQDGDQKHASPRELSQYEIGKQDAHIKLDKAERIERVNKVRLFRRW